MRKILIFILLSFVIFAFSLLSTAQDFPESSAQINPVRDKSLNGVKVLFSPQDNCAQEIVSSIDNAKSYVYVAMFYFTSRPIAQALVKAKDRGIDVKVCLDKEQPHYEYTKSKFLENKGINIKLIGGSGIMHNKFCIIDDYIIITGSYNWTVSADLKNDENLLIIESKEIARIYKEQFNKFWNGTFIDTCKYKDKNRLEKVPVATGVTLPIAKPSYKGKYVGSKNSNKFHYPDCKWAQRIKSKNQVWFNNRQEAIDKGYIPCKVCNP